jgi:hypothetical protein
MAHAVISSLRYSSDALSKSIIENLQAAAPFRDDDSSVIYYDYANSLVQEVETALSKVPNLEFEVPDRTKVDMIQHDISRRTEKVKRVRSQYLEQLDQLGISEGEVEQYVEGGSRGSKKI